MPTARQVHTRIHNDINSVRACLQRCASVPYPTAAREEKMAGVRAAADDLQAETNKAFNNIAEPTASKLATAVADVAAAQKEHQAASATGDQSAIQRANAAVQAANQRQNVASQEHQGANGLLVDQEAPDKLVRLVALAASLVDRAGELEKEIRAGEQLTVGVKADFSLKRESFEQAEKQHREQARNVFWAMAVAGIVLTFGIYLLFADPLRSTEAKSSTTTQEASGPAASEPPRSTIQIVERISLVATGRIALIVLAGYALKFLADLHRAHAEQSVVYRDRLAALGIAESLLNATPELAERRALLTALANVYLKFDESAFRRQERETVREERLAFDRQLGRLKKTVEAVRPLLEPAAKVAEKGAKATGGEAT
jgi:hypothetical protein